MWSRLRVLMSITLVLVAGLIVACDNGSTPVVSQINVQPSTSILIGEPASLTVEATGTNLRYKWTANRGGLSDPTAPSVLYTAPNTPGPDVVTVEVSSGESSTVRSITFDVGEPATATPTETPSPTPSLTPVPTETPTDTPTPTETPTSTPTPSPTPCPAGLVCEVFPQAGDGQAFNFMSTPGSLDPRFVEACAMTGQYGLQITYAFSGDDSGGWGVHWSESAVGHFDASGFSAFTFWIKGAAGGETFQIGLKDTAGTEPRVASSDLVVVSAAEWTKVTVPLSNFEGVNTSSIENVNFGFNRDHGSGRICLDDIAFVP